jgi:hypothetical protein
MHIISGKTLKSGMRRIVVDLVDGEELMAFKPAKEKVLVVKNDCFYKLGEPVEDIMAAHVLQDTSMVVWDSLEQKWLDVN